MADAVADGAEEAPKRGKKGLIIGLVLALIGAGGGFAFSSGMLTGGGAGADDHAAAGAGGEDGHGEDHGAGDGHGGGDHSAGGATTADGEPATFVPVDPIMISFGPSGARQHLRVQLRLETPVSKTEAVQEVMPRITDVLNGYLRAVDPVMLETPSMLTKLRAQMLRRVQIVAGDAAVNDLLILEFVLS